MRPCRAATAAASARVATPSFASTLDTWCSAVLRLMWSAEAIWGFVIPAATRRTTDSSRAVKANGRASPAGGLDPVTRTPRARSCAAVAVAMGDAPSRWNVASADRSEEVSPWSTSAHADS